MIEVGVASDDVWTSDPAHCFRIDVFNQEGEKIAEMSGADTEGFAENQTEWESRGLTTKVFKRICTWVPDSGNDE